MRRPGQRGPADDDPVDYANDNRIDPCRYSPKVLGQLKQLISNDLDSYSDLGAAVDDALARRAQGVCKKDAKTAPDPPPVGDGRGDAALVRRRRRRVVVLRRHAAGGVAPGQTAPAQPAPTPAVQPTAAPAVVATGDQILIAARTTDPATDAPFPIVALAILAGLLALGRAARRPVPLARLGAGLDRSLPPRRRRGRLARLVDLG